MGDRVIKVGDIVTRKSYNNDIVFKVVNISGNLCFLKGVYIRLLADSDVNDLVLYTDKRDEDEEDFVSRVFDKIDLERSDYFYLPGKILHIDSDIDYLERCIEYYKKLKLHAIGKNIKECDISSSIGDLINEYNPNIIVITGHDAYYKRKGSIDDLGAYKNSLNFVNAIKEARKIEMSHEKLIIIAGACQSNYEELIKAGANFASSPKRVNIHALDPSIIASIMALSDSSVDIDIKRVLNSTTKGPNGIGGVKTKGTMYIGYPR